MVRFKNRYFTLEITSAKNPNKHLDLKPLGIHNAIHNKVHQLYGDLGQASIRGGFNGDKLETKYCNPHTGIALVKVRHGPHKFVLNSLSKINDIDGQSVNIRILYVGATLKHCFLKIKEHNQKMLNKIWRDLKTDEHRRQMEELFTSITPAMKDFK